MSGSSWYERFSPDLNPIEYIWKDAKRVISKKTHQELECIEACDIKDFL